MALMKSYEELDASWLRGEGGRREIEDGGKAEKGEE